MEMWIDFDYLITLRKTKIIYRLSLKTEYTVFIFYNKINNKSQNFR